jgi:Uma2 family endonuclease
LNVAREVKSARRVEAAWYGGASMLDPEVLRPERPRPLKRVEFERLIEQGVFEDERVELLHGQLVAMSPQSDLHIRVTARIARILGQQLSENFDVLPHSGLQSWRLSRPEPDVSVVPRRKFRDPITGALLVVEVADSSLRKDKELKLPLYAQASIPCYWLVDLKKLVVEVYTQPDRKQYRRVAVKKHGDVLRVAGLRGVAIPVAKILPEH